MSESLSTDEIFALARGERILDDKWREPTKWEIYLAQQIERLTAELAQTRKELREETDRHTLTEVERNQALKELREAQEQAEYLCEKCNVIHPIQKIDKILQPCPQCGSAMRHTSVNLRRAESAEAQNASLAAQVAVLVAKLKQVDSHFNLPAEAEKLMRVVEAAKEYDRIRTEMEQKYKRPDLYFSEGSNGSEVRKAIRDLQGEKP